MRVTRSTTYLLTAVAAGVFVLLNWIFADGLFTLDSDVLLRQQEADGITVIAEGTIFTYVLLALIIAAGIAQARRLPEEGIALGTGEEEAATPGQVRDPAGWRLLLGNAYLAVLWMPLRFFVGREWLAAGEHKVRDSAWMDGGSALVAPGEAMGYWERVVAIPEPPARPSITYGWFRDLLQYMIDHGWESWFAKLIALGEFLVGLGLIVGALVGIAAFFGTLMNFNFLLAGSSSSNPVLFGLGVFLVLGWKVAGWWGLDRWLLPALGTPWLRGRLVGGDIPTETPPFEPMRT
jgi:thiosulfate dehydrogenase [quinone] large subunit